jgi:hypothetical protein
VDKTIVGLIAAIGSIATMAAAQAAVTPDAVDRAMSASSFALQSGSNVSATANDQRAATTKDGQVQVAQYYGYGYGYHPYGYGYGGGYGYHPYGYGYGGGYGYGHGYGGYGYGGYHHYGYGGYHHYY